MWVIFAWNKSKFTNQFQFDVFDGRWKMQLIHLMRLNSRRPNFKMRQSQMENVILIFFLMDFSIFSSSSPTYVRCTKRMMIILENYYNWWFISVEVSNQYACSNLSIQQWIINHNRNDKTMKEIRITWIKIVQISLIPWWCTWIDDDSMNGW